MLAVLSMVVATGALHLRAVPQLLQPHGRSNSIRMGVFDQFKKAFSNQDYSKSPAMYEQTYARAAHVLVSSEEQAKDIKEQIDAGNLDFNEAAMKFSSCNSAANGGNLGKFSPGACVGRSLKHRFISTLPSPNSLSFTH